MFGVLYGALLSWIMALVGIVCFSWAALEPVDGEELDGLYLSVLPHDVYSSTNASSFVHYIVFCPGIAPYGDQYSIILALMLVHNLGVNNIILKLNAFFIRGLV